ncbi:hypothetical protein V8C35DRAFT_284076 [Trichoderma chlorosporum]
MTEFEDDDMAVSPSESTTSQAVYPTDIHPTQNNNDHNDAEHQEARISEVTNRQQKEKTRASTRLQGKSTRQAASEAAIERRNRSHKARKDIETQVRAPEEQESQLDIDYDPGMTDEAAVGSTSPVDYGVPSFPFNSLDEDNIDLPRPNLSLQTRNTTPRTCHASPAATAQETMANKRRATSSNNRAQPDNNEISSSIQISSPGPAAQNNCRIPQNEAFYDEMGDALYNIISARQASTTCACVSGIQELCKSNAEMRKDFKEMMEKFVNMDKNLALQIKHTQLIVSAVTGVAMPEEAEHGT